MSYPTAAKEKPPIQETSPVQFWFFGSVDGPGVGMTGLDMARAGRTNSAHSQLHSVVSSECRS